ncbi:serine O-acetyltransferase [Pedosphaera parvula]|uniref:Serine acetyltransferase n=1 Tax=Pedosphaera parvula (strain Ellin514) TaxID=320771 RepID=B9XAY0_PEDPL|nr:serine acetyltransferase [Pedosphaera parvula]EEF63165.1 serine acetyltransferase [Pedosphaera parvula Ellin514]
MNWLSDFRCDLQKYALLNQGSWWKQLLLEQGLWALLEYRIEAALQRSNLPGIIKIPMRVLMLPWRKLVEIATGIILPCTAVIGPGLHLPHCGFRVVNAATVIGADCCISQGVTIGVSGRGERRGVPVIGDRVYFGANAVVVGKIIIGSDVCIGANSVVNRNVLPHCTVSGIPAVTINNLGSEDYITVTTGSVREKKMAGLAFVAKVRNQSV